jgi:hypothetical protein
VQAVQASEENNFEAGMWHPFYQSYLKKEKKASDPYAHKEEE